MGSIFDWIASLETAADPLCQLGFNNSSFSGFGPVLDDVDDPARQGFSQPGNFDTSEMLSPFSLPFDANGWDESSPLSSGDQWDSMFPQPHSLSVENLIQPFYASNHAASQEQAQRPVDCLPSEDFGQDILAASSGARFEPDFASQSLIEQLGDEQSVVPHTSPGNSRVSTSFQASPSSLPVSRYESLSTPSSSSAIDTLPAPKRMRYSPNGDYRPMHASAYNTGFERAHMGFAPPLARSSSEELTHLLDMRLSTNDGYFPYSLHSSSDGYLSPVAESFNLDTSLAQPSMSRKRRYDG